MIDLDVKYAHSVVEIAGDEDALLALCAGIKLCVKNGFEVSLDVNPITQSSLIFNQLSKSYDEHHSEPVDRRITNIVIEPDDFSNQFMLVDDSLVISGDEYFLQNLESNIPWDAQDLHSGLSCHVNYDKSSFGDYLDDSSLDVILTKKRNG